MDLIRQDFNGTFEHDTIRSGSSSSKSQLLHGTKSTKEFPKHIWTISREHQLANLEWTRNPVPS